MEKQSLTFLNYKKDSPNSIEQRDEKGITYFRLTGTLIRDFVI